MLLDYCKSTRALNNSGAEVIHHLNLLFWLFLIGLILWSLILRTDPLLRLGHDQLLETLPILDVEDAQLLGELTAVKALTRSPRTQEEQADGHGL